MSTSERRAILAGDSGRLSREWLTDRASIISVLATVATEVASFEQSTSSARPRASRSSTKGVTTSAIPRPGDGIRYHGRGFIQLTGRANHRSYGKKLAVALEDDPDLALDADVAARVLTHYFEDRKIAGDARKGDWQQGPKEGQRRAERLRPLQLGDPAREGFERSRLGTVAGAIGPDVIELKRLLVKWGKPHPLPQPLKLTPLFGEATTAAVKAFQRANGIQPTGRGQQDLGSSQEG